MFAYAGSAPHQWVDHDGRLISVPPSTFDFNEDCATFDSPFLTDDTTPPTNVIYPCRDEFGILHLSSVGPCGGPGGGAGGGGGGAILSRALTAEDLGLQGVTKLEGTFTVKEGVATMRVDMIEGVLRNPINAINNMAQTARAAGANILRIEGRVANERLYNVLQQRFGLTTNGGMDTIIINLR